MKPPGHSGHKEIFFYTPCSKPRAVPSLARFKQMDFFAYFAASRFNRFWADPPGGSRQQWATPLLPQASGDSAGADQYAGAASVQPSLHFRALQHVSKLAGKLCIERSVDAGVDRGRDDDAADGRVLCG